MQSVIEILMGHINSSLYNMVITSILFCKATFLLAILATLCAIPLYLQLFEFLIATLVVHKHVYNLSTFEYLNCFIQQVQGCLSRRYDGVVS